MKPVRVRRHPRRRPESVVYRGDPVIRTDSSSRSSPFGDYLPLGTVGSEKAIIKYGQSQRESAASTLDDLLDFHVVPPTVVRMDTTGEGVAHVSVQELVPDARKWGRMTQDERDLVNRDDLFKIAIIDIITNQSDRHGGNLLVSPDNRAYAIDNEFMFGDEGWLKSVAVTEMYGKEIPRPLIKKLKALGKGDFMATFASVKVGMEEIERAWKRKVGLQKSGRIDWRLVPKPYPFVPPPTA